MIELKQNTVLRETPKNLLHDEKVVNLAKALDVPLSRSAEWGYKINYTQNLHALDEAILDYLLWEKHIGWFEGLSFATTREQKINLIEASIDIHRRKGTPYAIERVLQAINLPGQVMEWFQYGGDPYYFKIQLALDDMLSRDFRMDHLKELINTTKNQRSWLDGIILKAQIILNQKWTNKAAQTVLVRAASNPWAFAGDDGSPSIEKFYLNGVVDLDGEVYLKSFEKKDGPANKSDIRLVLQVLQDFGAHKLIMSPVLDGEYYLDSEINLQNDLHEVILPVLHETSMSYKKRQVLVSAPVNRTEVTSAVQTMAGINTLSGAKQLNGHITMNQSLLTHKGLFRVKKAGIVTEEEAG